MPLEEQRNKLEISMLKMLNETAEYMHACSLLISRDDIQVEKGIIKVEEL